MNNLGKIFYVVDQIGNDEVLAQLAEEAIEVGHAALKLRRANNGRNPTPVSSYEAGELLLNEIGDLMLCFKVLMVSTKGGEAYVGDVESSLNDFQKEKLDRWVQRLKEAEGRNKAEYLSGMMTKERTNEQADNRSSEIEL